MSALDKTATLLRQDIPIGEIHKSENNPNEMSSRAFDLLVDNINKVGLTDPIMVCVLSSGGYRIIGGHHRFEAAVFLGFEEVPCTIITDPTFDQEEQDFQLVRMNAIRGKLSPKKFFALYQEFAGKYGDQILQDSFGFADDEEWKRLVDQTAKQLPDASLQAKFKEAAAEIKTIDGLSKLLNQMFTLYGNTVPYSYMVVEYGGQHSVWLRASKKTYEATLSLGHVAIDNSVSLDALLGALLIQVAGGKLAEALAAALEACPKLDIPDGFQGVPTEDKIASMKAMSD